MAICFVLFCYVMMKSPKPLHFMPHSCIFKNFWWVGVHQLGLRLFGSTMCKLLIIKSFFEWKLNKIKNENYTEFGSIFGVVQKYSTS
jgi:hypothetical protein